MMKGKYILLISILTLGLSGCFDPPVYPNVPNISFNDLRFVDVPGAQDSLILVFDFTDGDGNIGLDPDEVFPPYHSFNVVLDADFDLVFLDDSTVRFPLYQANPFDLDGTRPPEQAILGVYSQEEINLPAYNCRDYILIQDLTADSLATDKTDTVLIDLNEFSSNIILNIYKKQNGDLINITRDFSLGGCQDAFNSRIPIFDSGNIGRALEGTITYPMLSSGFQANFLNDSIFIEFFIYDRDLNKSNTIRTPDFTLQSLLGV
jgi:hypothetical protein